MRERQDLLERSLIGQQATIGILSQAVLRLEERQNEQGAALTQQIAQSTAASNARMDRFEEGLERLEMLVENMLRSRPSEN